MRQNVYIFILINGHQDFTGVKICRNMCTILEINFISLFPPSLRVLCIASSRICSLAGQEMLVFSFNSLTLDLGYIHQN